MSTSPSLSAGPTADAFAERMLTSALGWIDVMSAYLGDRLGWYRSLADAGPSTPDELADRTGTSPRYAREWLEQQAVSGILTLDDSGRYTLPPGPAEVLTDAASLAYLAPLSRLFAATGAQTAALLEAYRTGGGVSWEQFGPDAREAQADLNRPWFGELAGAFATVPELHAVLSRPGARIADIGMGGGWSSIELAKAHPGLRVDGFDVDEPSIALARENAEAAGVADRVEFHNADGDGLAHDGPFDAAFAFECIHDMPRPVEVLEAMRLAVRDGGPVIVMDEAVADRLVAPGDELERIMYGFSLFCCLPDGLSHQPSVGTGTVMRPGILRRYAQEAGFADLEILPIEDFSFFRFYSLTR
ncbi:class I SAM-dependent methyltransferase [Microbacterium sp. SSM24]|uniref:class I SAM-dependent methyltransferase n=1 Tax=Microbacterium sp. SSM24 TaxID=2991714 RepID=UPI00222804BA|nr:class I SAM-dependent methyltransferase [Microbacterium sp. SSM24]MCW3493290.1 methyltransferase domain-containing protein [Microbacterium sp. SSM24]